MKTLCILVDLVLIICLFCCACDCRFLKPKRFQTLHEWTKLNLAFGLEKDLEGELSWPAVPVDIDIEYGGNLCCCFAFNFSNQNYLYLR